MRESLEQQRRTAVLDLSNIMLRRGQHRALVTGLAEEAVAYPADKRLIGQLMLALRRSGRQAEALQRFEQTRRQLAEEFGADPGPRLQALHQQILRADPSLIALRASNREHTGPVLRQLPAFAGPAAELAELRMLPAPAAISPAAGTSRTERDLPAPFACRAERVTGHTPVPADGRLSAAGDAGDGSDNP